LPRAPDAFRGARGAPPPGAADRPATKDLPVQRPLAGPLPALAAPAGSDSKDGQSDDGTLAWRSTVLPDGAREFTVWMWKDGNMTQVLHETAAAPAPLPRHPPPLRDKDKRAMWELFVSAFVTLFVVIDPPGCAPIYAGLTAGPAPRRRATWRSAPR
jgi:hypothetical protein